MEDTHVAASEGGPISGAKATEADIRLQRVTKRFHDTVAVDDLTLEIERGSFFALLGPSGCGKTTTLRLIGGFEDPTHGRIFLGSRDVTDHPPFRRDVNTVFQSYALFPHLTVARNVAFGLERRGHARKEVRRRVSDMLDLVQLTGLEERRPDQLSGGQQQRVALARALVNQPRALLLDEPLGALDLRLRRQLQLELKRIQQELGLTFVHVTHDQEEALTMADTIAVMNEGRIEQLGSGEELYERPRTEFVARFLGTSNLIDGSVRGRDGGLAEFAGDDGAVLRVPVDRLPAGGGAVRLGVRPEKVSILATTDVSDVPSGHNTLQGHVMIASYLGVAIQYQVSSAGGREMTALAPNRGVGAAASIGPGRAVLLHWDPAHTFAVPRQEAIDAGQ